MQAAPTFQKIFMPYVIGKVYITKVFTLLLVDRFRYQACLALVMTPMSLIMMSNECGQQHERSGRSCMNNQHLVSLRFLHRAALSPTFLIWTFFALNAYCQSLYMNQLREWHVCCYGQSSYLLRLPLIFASQYETASVKYLLLVLNVNLGAIIWSDISIFKLKLSYITF